MIAYRDTVRFVNTGQELRSLGRALESATWTEEQTQELLIALGELEAGVLDAICPEIDRDGDVAQAFRRASLAAGHILRRSWQGTTAGPWRERARAAVHLLARLPLPEAVRAGVPEGYAWYALYPESYCLAAARLFADARPGRAAVVGIRSIGTSLSAAVAAELEAWGVEVRSWTVRPRGHPFQRRLALDPRLAQALAGFAGAHFAVVDEGPGLSGSSFAAVADELSRLGVPDDRIVLFPAWTPDGSAFVSEAARERWRRHRKYAAGSEDVWLARNGRPGVLDVSGGAWRPLVYDREERWPAVQPQHERRKYLDRGSQGATLLKFAGLGRFGRSKLARAERLAEAGFAPRPLGLADGFIRLEFVEGNPCGAAGETCRVPEFLDTMGRYLAWLRANCQAPCGVPFDGLLDMIRVNAQEGLGEAWADRVNALERFRGPVSGSPAVALDGRMLPHEWLATPRGYLKTDGLDHHDDHFFPGCQDIAWDVAGASLEFALDTERQRHFTETCARLAGDPGLPQRLPFYRAAYLAFRLGYTTLAGHAIGATADGERFAALARRYRRMLRGELELESVDRGS